MNMIKTTEINLLKASLNNITDLSKSFRVRVCEECNWSETTFYRKSRKNKPFSNAEKEKIISISQKLLNECAEKNNQLIM
jgi:hypothetical protein